MSDDELSSETPRMGGRKGARPPLDVGAVARDDALLDAIGSRRMAQFADRAVPGAEADPATTDPVVAMLQAFVADLDDQLVAAHPRLEDDDRAMGLQLLPGAVASLVPAQPLTVAARNSEESDESAVLSGPAGRRQAAAKILATVRGTRIARELPASAHRRRLDRRTAVTSAAAMAVAFTVSLTGVAAAVTGDPMTPYRQVLETVGITAGTAEVSTEAGVDIGRDLGAAQAAVDRGDVTTAREFIAQATKALEEHLDNREVDEGSVAADLQDALVELNQDADMVEAAAEQEAVIAEGEIGADAAVTAEPGTDDPGTPDEPSGGTFPEEGDAQTGSSDSPGGRPADESGSGNTPASPPPSPEGDPTEPDEPSDSSGPSSPSPSGSPASPDPSAPESSESTPADSEPADSASSPSPNPSPTASPSSPSPTSSPSTSPSSSPEATSTGASTDPSAPWPTPWGPGTAP